VAVKRGDSPERIREEILAMVRRYCEAAFSPGPFEPGKTRVPYAGRVFDDRELTNLVEASLDFWLTQGRFTREFERSLARYLGIEHCLFVNSGSSANLLGFMALTSPELGDRAIERGDEVITTAACFPTTVAPIVQFGAVPVFVDIQLPGCNADPELFEEAVSTRTKAVVLAHTLGNPFDLVSIRSFCRRHGLWLIEDNCDALGSRYGGKLTGTLGHLGTSSFYPPHHMTTGEGGAVYTDDGEIAAILGSLRDWGRDCVCPPGIDDSCGKRFSGKHGLLPEGYDHKYVYSHFGYNLKATDLQAAVGLAQLEKLDDFVEARRRNWQVLFDGLEDLEDLFVLPKPDADSSPSWFGFLLIVRDSAPFSRAEIVRHLEDLGIQTRVLFAGNLLRHPCFNAMRESGTGYRVPGELTRTDLVMRSAFWVGVYPGMSDAMLNHIISTVRGFVRQ
jgi:CDP-6-deoxy-D-xylo-4-hexulose-3-dehydrase